MNLNMELRVTPKYINELKPNEVYVFGSNLPGLHVVGSANIAHSKWGAKWGKGVGLYGQSYAIPTMQGSIETIRPYVNRFIEFAKKEQNKTFLVTPICDIANIEPKLIAPLFTEAINVKNIYLPKCFWNYLV